MSGGHYDYLCFKEVGDLLSTSSMEDVEKISNRLSELGHSEAAQASHRALLTLRKVRDMLTAVAKDMNLLWHAVEWLDSCDYSEECVAQVVKEWKEGDVAA